MTSIAKILSVALVVSVIDSGAIAQPAPSATELAWAQNNADRAEFKQRLFTLLGQFDRTTTKTADIAAIMGVTFVPDPVAKSFEIPAAPDKQVAVGYKSLKGQQYVLPLSEMGGTKDVVPAVLEDAVLYGFEMPDLGDDPQTCLTISELKVRFPVDTTWRFTQLGMFYLGVTGAHKGAKVAAFIDDSSFHLTPEVEAELAKLDSDSQRDSDPVKAARYQALKASFDGCVSILDLF